MPLSHRHAHPPRDVSDVVGDIIDGKDTQDLAPELVKDSPAVEIERDSKAIGGQFQEGAKDAAIPTVIENPTQTKDLGNEIAKATGEATMTNDKIAGDQTMAAPTTVPTKSSSDNSSSDSSDGTSAGVKAGIAFGVLGGILLIALLVYFIISKRKKSQRAAADQGEEKLTPLGGAMPPPPPMKDQSKSPRLSLRPVTQFFPQFSADKRASREMGMSSRPVPSPYERPGTSQSTHPSNPFGNQAERAPSPVTEEHSMYSRSIPPTPDRDLKPLPAGGRQTSMHADESKHVDLTLPESRVASPTGTEFSMSSVTPGTGAGGASGGAAAIAAAGGPKNTAVHRVQLDFKPSLDDEMELKAGELVRLLHEYDDGWALCIRLDRSRQGVVPRTCLSTRPVKPRPPQGGPRGPPVNPQGGPRYQPGPGQRPMTPQDRSESPMRPKTSTGPRPASPGGFRSQSPMGRPMSPAGRFQSPGPGYQGGRQRAPSRGHGPSPMNPGPAPNRGPSPGPPPGLAM